MTEKTPAPAVITTAAAIFPALVESVANAANNTRANHEPEMKEMEKTK